MADFSQSAILARWWQAHVAAGIDHVEVLDRVHEDAGWTNRYLFMTTMSAGIAVLGLLLSSPAVVIGAMLISPLMGPIIGLGFALATVDSRYIRRSAVALAAGSLIAILFCALLTLVSPLQNVTAEIAARTRPNLFDLLVAVFSALAGTYATIKGRAGTIVGVAIATALMPPLATIGFGLATGNGTVFFGALLLFVTNFVAIALVAAIMARLYGFASTLSPNQSMWQTIAIIAVFIALAVPLGLSLRQIAWENLAGRQARTAVTEVFPDNARISQIDVDYSADPIKVTATVLTPAFRQQANSQASRLLTDAIGTKAQVSIVQYRVGTADAEAAELAKAQNTSKAPTVDPMIATVTNGLALIAGTDQDAVLVDAAKHTAFVRARPLPDATLATYRALEQRLGRAADGWRVELMPPALPLGDVAFDGDTPLVTDVLWAAQRRGDAVEVSGTRGDAVADALAKAGVTVTRGPATGTTRVAWSDGQPPA